MPDSDEAAKDEVQEESKDVVEQDTKDGAAEGAENGSEIEGKRKREDEAEDGDEDEGSKKAKTDQSSEQKEEDDGPEPDPVPPSTEGISEYGENDVLSGRGGGTNVHPGNRTFRDLINLHRRAYLKARKNDKPAISRAIVRQIRQSKGRFLRKDEKSNLWFEIGDDAAREKTSQALRQRAPEMRKLLFDTEREEARAAAEEHARHHRMVMGVPPPDFMAAMQNMPPMMPGPGGVMFPNPAFMGMMPPPPGMKMPNGADYSQMYNFMQQQHAQAMSRFSQQQNPGGSNEDEATGANNETGDSADGGDVEAEANKRESV